MEASDAHRSGEGLPLFDAVASQAAKDEGQSSVYLNNFDWIAKARTVAMAIVEREGHVTSDMIQKELPRPEHVNANSVGAVFRGLPLRAVGFMQTDRTAGHARQIRVWQKKYDREDTT